ncbi:sensor domain-containing diguanylate cyclase [Jeongeupia chitinilytica]|uniref:diguanylate cyclase n=1 Tax=Jeongeupia chitinilytica TaxID=1041641 RepID=A0ABQ3H501_9NEIS|nr:sensor domain-containing diguanylate cyclase [Jeongeupia chitinilytica]GHD67229.1 hypothetical protein GCM10007350_30710 [Jeongeupia chitinilytica]
MKGIKNTILAKPLECGLLLFVVLGLLWLPLAERWSRDIVFREVARQISVLETQKRAELAQTVVRLDRRIELIKSLPRMVAEQTDVRLVMINPELSQARSNADRLLALLAENLPLDKILVFDRSGELRLSSDLTHAERMPDIPVPQGQAFDDAMRGRNGLRYGVGLVSKVPGYYFSAPIQHGDMILGAVLVKLERDRAQKEILDRDLLLVDNNGVVVLSSDPARQLQVLDGTGGMKLPPAERLQLYGKADLTPLKLQPYGAPLPANVVTIAGEPLPYLHFQLAEHVPRDLHAHLLVPLPQMQHMNERQRILLWPMLCAGFLALGLALMLLIYLVRTRLLRQQLTQANEELRRQAESDALTGIANRRKFNQDLDAELARGRRYGHRFSVAIIDIDFFKKVNDVHGHPAGDAALVYLADVVSLAIRDTDHFARLGGEEFGLLLPDTGDGGTAQLLERLRATIEEGHLVYDELAIPLTISIGFACAGPGESAEDLMRRADEALYAAKQGGRNRVQAAAPC